MAEWEYKVIELQFQGGEDEIDQVLNEEGKYGWELVNVVNLGLIRAKAFLKREI